MLAHLQGERVGPVRRAIVQTFCDRVRYGRDWNNPEDKGPSAPGTRSSAPTTADLGSADLKAFRNELQMAGKIDHPNVVRVEYAAPDADPPYSSWNTRPAARWRSRSPDAGRPAGFRSGFTRTPPRRAAGGAVENAAGRVPSPYRTEAGSATFLFVVTPADAYGEWKAIRQDGSGAATDPGDPDEVIKV